MSGGVTIASFDLGSNTARGILARAEDATILRVLDADQRMTALGRGLSENDGFDPEALDATVAFVAETLRRWGHPGEVHAVATAAARTATNGGELIARLRDEAGVTVQIIDGVQEARLAWLGALSTEPELPANNPAVVDIGGRSTEVVVERDGVLQSLSRPMGARSLTEVMSTFDGEPFLRAPMALMVAVPVFLGAFQSMSDCDVVVAIGGTAQAAARLLGTRVVSYDQVNDLETKLSELSPAERRARMPFDPERAEIICAGLLLVALFAKPAPESRLTVSEGGVREGLLLDRAGAERLIWR